MASILILNRLNLNLLVRREPGIDGHTTLADIESMCAAEGELATWIQDRAWAVRRGRPPRRRLQPPLGGAPGCGAYAG
jgi:hypothetical protein